MNIVDLHSDLFTDIAWRRNAGETDVFDRIHYPRLRAGLVDTIICVLWVEPAFRKQPAMRFPQIFKAVLEDLAHSKHAVICTSLAEASLPPESEKIRVVLGLEGLSFLESESEQLEGRLRNLHEDGIRHLILAWNEVNAFASGTGADVPAASPGLTELGMQAIDVAQRHNWFIDVSHLDRASFWDVHERTTIPLMASHSNARAVFDHERNLDDSQLKAIAAGGGIIGLNACGDFVDGSSPTLDRFIDHAIHIAEVAGIESLGFGFDFMDYLVPLDIGMGDFLETEGLENVTKVPALLERMAQRGFSNNDIEAIASGNALRFLKNQ